VQDPGEQGVADVIVNLYDGGGNLIGSDTTDVSGLYGFDNLPPGDYVVEVIPPADSEFSPQDQGGDDTADSDVDETTGRTGTITLTSGENDPTNDAGLVPLASLGDYVWFDEDRDGVQDAGEQGIGGVTVNLLDDQGVVIATTTTDSTGFYEFTNLSPDTYQVEFVTPNGYIPTAQNQGGDDAKDSDADPATGLTQQVTLAPGENNPTLDAGFYDIFDLAITKQLATGQAAAVGPGDDVTFTIEVFNQGTRAAYNVEVVDYLPAMTTLNDNDWTDNGNGTASYTLAGPIQPNGSATVDITITVSPFFNANNLTNLAEITAARDPRGVSRDDEDGTFDNDPGQRRYPCR
jgi:uncharacterized repeat protein (TIGR01451 family)